MMTHNVRSLMGMVAKHRI